MNATELTPELTALVNTARVLPPELVRQVADFAEFLGKKRAALPIDESDAWTDEDIRDWRRHTRSQHERFPPAEVDPASLEQPNSPTA